MYGEEWDTKPAIFLKLRKGEEEEERVRRRTLSSLFPAFYKSTFTQWRPVGCKYRVLTIERPGVKRKTGGKTKVI